MGPAFLSVTPLFSLQPSIIRLYIYPSIISYRQPINHRKHELFQYSTLLILVASFLLAKVAMVTLVTKLVSLTW